MGGFFALLSKTMAIYNTLLVTSNGVITLTTTPVSAVTLFLAPSNVDPDQVSRLAED
jgi:hypothetical protein